MAAISTSNPLQRLLPLPLLASITIFLTLLHRVNSTVQLSFDFNRFDPDQEDLIFQGDATIPRSNVLQLTEVDNRGLGVRHRTGRALYSAPVRLWDRSSGREASFETTFTFNISTHVTVPPADGLAFFIAPPDTTIPVGSNGPLLGLFNGSAANGVVAVEFDTFVNQDLGDPNFRHIGINVNSIRSSAVARWDWQNGGIATATISYDSASKILSVVSSYPNASPVIVTYDINLSTVLPEWVRVGFSATTGVEWSEINDILSWSFSSNLRFNIKAEEEKDGYIASVV